MKIKFKKVDDINSEDNHILWELYQKSYHLNYEEFVQKQRTLDRYALYYSKNKKLIGFTGIRDHSFQIEHRTYRAIYFGQTIIDKQFRGKNLIQNTVVKLIFRHFFRFKKSKLLIWNDAISYRPYLIMAKNLKVYYPSNVRENEQEHTKIRDILGQRYYGESYCLASGTVKKPKTTLQSSELEVTEKQLAEPHIRYYISKNPNFRDGHGLITFCPATFNNLMFYLRKRFVRHA